MIQVNKKIAFIGAGSLAESIVSGIIQAGVVAKEDIFVTNKSNQERLRNMETRYQVQCMTNKEEIVTDAKIIILAIKPKDAKDSIASIKDYLDEKQLIISVIAGLSTDKIMELIGIPLPVIRVMPNTSALIGYSSSAIASGKYAREQHVQIADELFKTVGITKIVEEKDMHTVTAISGSGPAFLYYFVEAMEKAAIESGLDKQIAADLIAQTVIGAGKMLQQSGETPAILRENITSSGGTTEAGLKDLDKHDFQQIIISCIRAAQNRSIELGEIED